MKLFGLPRTNAGRFFSFVLCVAVALATSAGIACLPVSASDVDPSEFYGLLLNADISSNFLGGIRLADGRSLSLFGRFAANGEIAELQEIAYEDVDGGVTSLTLESGKPVSAVVADGTTVGITYEQADADRLAGVVRIVSAADGKTTEVPFDVDLAAALDQIAQTVSDLTDGAVQLSPEKGEGADAARSVVKTDVAAKNAKSAKNADGRQQVGFLVATAIAATVAVTGLVIVQAMSQIMEAVLVAVAASIQLTIIAIFTPLILLGEICRLALFQPQLQIEVEFTPAYLPSRR